MPLGLANPSAHAISADGSAQRREPKCEFALVDLGNDVHVARARSGEHHRCYDVPSHWRIGECAAAGVVVSRGGCVEGVRAWLGDGQRIEAGVIGR